MTEPIKFETGLKYAAMATKIRTGVVEALIPAIPYLLNFNITDYSYIFSYVEDKVLDEAKQAGLGREYLDAADALQKWVTEKVEKQEKERAQSDATSNDATADRLMTKVTDGLMSGKVDPIDKYTMKTPYLLSQYYGNKPDMSVIDLKIVEDDNGFWRGWKDILPFKINGIKITGKWAFPSLAMFFCINTSAFSNMWDK
ncbi:MAG: hypothetical protein VX879_08760, partial [Pseudomonadota bacterium]|nr:hypothetical protein [Pseudomonadota bacterium]